MRAIRRLASGAILGLAACASTRGVEGGTGYEREIEVRGTVVEATAYLFRGDEGSGEAGSAVAIETAEGVFLLLPPGRSASDRPAADAPDTASEERMRLDLRRLAAGERVLVTGELYRRGGLQGIEVESIERE